MEKEEDMTFVVQLPADFPLADLLRITSILEQADVFVPGYIPPDVGLYDPGGYFYGSMADDIDYILLLVKNPFELIALTKKAASNVGEILLQFPLYAGIMGIMAGTGLITVISDAFVSISNEYTFGLLAFIAAGIVNFFVPSGGGQFAVQAPVMIEAAANLGVDPVIPIMAVAYGDQWTNMIQPFWALPLLAIAGLKMRDILSYTTITLVASGLVFGTTMVLISL